MKIQSFYKVLTLSIAISLLLHLGLAAVIPIQHHNIFGIFCLFFFTVLTIITYFAGNVFIQSTYKAAFTSFSMGIIFFKLLSAILIILGYHYLVIPTDLHFVFIFAIYYLVFSFGEVYILMKLSKQNA
jgi:hypothetical protein